MNYNIGLRALNGKCLQSRRLPRTVGLTVLSILACAACRMGPFDKVVQSPPDLAELAWIAPGQDAASLLTWLPPACLRNSSSIYPTGQRAGELAFNSPALLGGQAAKIGLTCGACHRNGRGNPDFFVPSVSDQPGRADVSSGVFSPHRADDIFNPTAIPDLATPQGQDQVNRQDRHALQAFTIAQITDEFAGTPPPAGVLDDLVLYLMAIGTDPCPSDTPERYTWKRDWQAAMDAAAIAMRYRTFGDGESDAFYIRTARAALGRLYARYDGPAHEDIRTQLVGVSRALAMDVSVDETAWEALAETLNRAAATSLYNPRVLRARLGASP